MPMHREHGIWISNAAPLAQRGGAALLLDRDGVLVREAHYLARPQDVHLERGAVELIRWVHGRGMTVATITNQSGIARGLFDWNAFEAVEHEIARRFAEQGVSLDLTIACPFHPEHTQGYGEAHARWRKPGPAMIELAAERLGFDAQMSWMIGDTASDVGAARNAGLAGAIHVLTGHGAKERERALSLATDNFRVLAARDLDDALMHLRTLFPHTETSPHKTKSIVRGDDPFRLAEVQRWMFDEALPFWVGVGQDRPGRGFVERLTMDGQPEALPYKRLRVQARQIYVFCHASSLGWQGPALEAARNGMEFVTRHAWLPEGGWALKLGVGGGIEDPTLALYEQSFMLFALGWYARVTGDAAAIELAHRTIDTVYLRLGLGGGFGFRSEPSQGEVLEQNPHMHYLEAMLTLYETTREKRFLDEARNIVALLQEQLFQPDKGVLPEFFDKTWRALPGERGRLIEPGHHFEWVWLLAEYRRVTGEDLSEIACRLFDFAEMHGVERETGLAYDAVLDNGALHAPDHRSWCQTEALKAHLAMGDHGRIVDEVRVAQITGNLLDRYLGTSPRGVWIDHLSAELKLKATHIPATSLYHFFLAFAELRHRAGVTA